MEKIECPECKGFGFYLCIDLIKDEPNKEFQCECCAGLGWIYKHILK